VIKIFPFIFTSLFFFLIIANVRNLTLDFGQSNELNESNITNTMVKEESFNKAIKSYEELNSNHTVNDYESIEKKVIKTDSSSIKKKLEDDSHSLFEFKNDEKKFEEKNSNNYKHDLQFGAFSKKQNAVNHSIKVIDVLKTKFPYVDVKVTFDKKNNLYKVISSLDNKNLLKKICDEINMKNLSCFLIKK
tara:strand:- start:5560 stop:6129 length:570 start_codon:yes stop_codon:yes gene_type:complete